MRSKGPWAPEFDRRKHKRKQPVHMVKFVKEAQDNGKRLLYTCEAGFYRCEKVKWWMRAGGQSHQIVGSYISSHKHLEIHLPVFYLLPFQ